MGDMGDDFRAMREANKERREHRGTVNSKAIEAACAEFGLAFEHFWSRGGYRITAQGTRIEMFPKSGRYCILGANRWGRFTDVREFLEGLARAAGPRKVRR